MDTDRVDPSEFFRAHVMEASEGCRIWPFPPGASKYPHVRYSHGLRFAYGQLPLHVATCLAWNGEKPTATHQAAHACGHTLCWAGEHLGWKTPKENQADRYIHGTMMLGKLNHNTKLTVEDVREIRRLSVLGGHENTRKALGERYGVRATTIQAIVSRENWAWVPDEVDVVRHQTTRAETG